MSNIIRDGATPQRNPEARVRDYLVDGHPDGCPACMAGVAEPWAVAPRTDGSTLEHYACPECDYRWHAEWWENPGGTA